MLGKLILSTSGLAFALAGAALVFFPQEVATTIGLPPKPLAILPLQLLAAAQMGFGFLNWYSRANVVGGIYSRPLVLANFLFCGVSAISLGKAFQHLPAALLAAFAVFALFTAAFGWLLFFADPSAKKSPSA